MFIQRSLVQQNERRYYINFLHMASLCLSCWLLMAGRVLAQQCPDAGLQVVIQQLSSTDDSVVKQAQTQLAGQADQNGASVVECLILTIQNEQNDPQFRINAIWTLNAMEEDAKPAIPVLVSLIQTHSDELGVESMRVLGNLSLKVNPVEVEPATVDTLVDKFQVGNLQVLRAQALITLVNIGAAAETATPALIVVLSDPDPELQKLAIAALTRMGFKAESAVTPLTLLLQSSPDPELQQLVARGISVIADSVANHASNVNQLPTAKLKAMISELEGALTILKRLDNPAVAEYVTVLQRALNDLKHEVDRRELTILKHPVAIVLEVYFALLILSLLLLNLFPIALLRLNQLLKPFTLSIPTPFGLGGISLSARYLLLVGLFNDHPHVLDAWANARIDNARNRFAEKKTVRERQVYVPLPIILNDRHPIDLKPSDLQAMCRQNRWRALIWGEGGVGKTTLACQIAQWMMKESVEDSPCNHFILPVLIEEGLDKQTLLDVIHDQLKDVVNEAEKIDEELLLNLLKKKRVLVIVDHLSEMSQAARDRFQADLSDLPINALLITSRLRELQTQSIDMTLFPLGIARDRLLDFVSLYLLQQGKSHLFSDPDRQEICRRLSQIMGDRALTVLLAKLYLDQVIGIRASSIGDVVDQLRSQNFDELPTTVPELILYYLNRLNQSVVDNRQEDEVVRQDAKAIAWECVRQTYHPDWIGRQTAIAAMGGDTAETRFKYLRQRLNIIKTSASGEKVRVGLDPLAEYLAAMQVIDLNGNDQAAWKAFFADADTQSNAPTGIQGFLSALKDCYVSLKSRDVIATFILSELDQRLPTTA